MGLAVWEIHDGDFVDLSCAECAHKFLEERGVLDHELGKNYYSAEDELFAQEDVYGEHAGQTYTCNGCGAELN